MGRKIDLNNLIYEKDGEDKGVKDGGALHAICAWCAARSHYARNCLSSCEMHRLLRDLQNWVTMAIPNAGWTFLQELCRNVLT